MTNRPLVTQNTWSQDPNGVSVRSQANVWSNSLVTNLSPPVATIFRTPLTAFRSWHKDPSGVLYNYFQTQALEEVPPTLTIQSFDYPNPLGPRYPVDLRTWLGNPPITPPVPPTSNYDQPNPRGYTYPSDLRTFLQSIAPTNPIPSNVTNWPNPLGPLYPSSNNTWLRSGFNQLEAGVVQVPAEANYDWPNPRGYIHPSDLRTFTLNTALTLKALAPVPVAAFDWPNPVIRPWTPAPVVFTNSLQVLALQAPLTQKDFPNPVLRVYPTDRLSFYNRSDYLYGFINTPIAQYDWPVPKGPVFPVDNRTWIQTIIAAEDTPPRENYDQPNPVLGKWSPINLTFISGTSRELQALIQTPAKTTYDRPNPIGYTPALSIRTGQSYPIPLTLLTFVPPASTGLHSRYFFADMGRMWSNM